MFLPKLGVSQSEAGQLVELNERPAASNGEPFLSRSRPRARVGQADRRLGLLLSTVPAAASAGAVAT